MNRSEINQIIREAEQFFEEQKIALPPFARWTLDDWKKNFKEMKSAIELGMGWDITDFGSNDFERVGLLLFTLRNGIPGRRGSMGKPYAEKIMIVNEQQVTPRHTHKTKIEDIINRGGGELVIQLWPQAEDGTPSTQGEVKVFKDGTICKVRAGFFINLLPGESVTLEPGHYHKFWGAKGKGKVLIGEVSSCNDDVNDNVFNPPVGRFPTIVEDEPPYRLLVKDYEKFLQNGD